MPVHHPTLRKTITKCIEEQYRTTWEAVFTEFGLSTKDAFYQLLLDEPKLKDTIARYCKVERCTVASFKDFYNFLLPDTRPKPKPDPNYKPPQWAR